MPTRNYPGSLVLPNGRVVRVDTGSITWSNSPRVNGRLRLRANPMSQTRTVVQRVIQGSYQDYTGKTRFGGSPLTAQSWIKPERRWPVTLPPGLVNEAHARFLRLTQSKQRASLGVTLASYRQSTNMIARRVSHASSLADKRIAVLKSRRGRREVKRRLAQLRSKYGSHVIREKPADLYLEGIFGWAPLFTDIRDSMAVLVNLNEYGSRFIRASAKRSITSDTYRYLDTGNNGTDRSPGKKSGSHPRHIVVLNTYKVTESAKVTVANPNLHMANRLGLLNLPKIGWDLVPFSFVVNFFVNTNQMLDNLSAFAGLTIDNASVTRTSFSRFHGEWDTWTDMPGGYKPVHGGSMTYHVSKNRTLGTASFSWNVSLPNGDVSLAATAAALLTQKFRTIKRLVDRIT